MVSSYQGSENLEETFNYKEHGQNTLSEFQHSGANLQMGL